MNLRWWDEAHESLGRIHGDAELLAVRDKARQTARDQIAPLVNGAHPAHGWTEDKASVLHILDNAGLTGLAAQCLTMPLALTVWELATIDAGVATLSLSGSLAQMPIRDFGTTEQKARYLEQTNFRHGALCLTEPLPGAGAEAVSLSGRMFQAGDAASGQPLLKIEKRGRFTSHMDFADFVVAAVEGDGGGVLGSGLVILEPEDTGQFERGTPARKLGHHFASTTNPIFDLTIPASRLVGGYTVEQGIIVPRFSHRAVLEPALRRMRTLLALMTAAKALATVQRQISSASPQKGARFRLALADLWATGEAAASLGFAAVRLSDDLKRAENASLAALLSSAAKLYSSSRIAETLIEVSAHTDAASQASQELQARLIDAQIEEMYMGPSALQRRLVSAAMTGARFLAGFEPWTQSIERAAERLPQAGLPALAEGMRLWHWTLQRLRERVDGRGAKLYCDARQGVSFAMADALCELLAARSMALDLLQAERNFAGRDQQIVSVFSDLLAVAAGRAASRCAQICTDLLFGYAERFPVSSVEQKIFNAQRARLFFTLRGTLNARQRVADFLRAPASRF
jgi:hypothetical protein